MTQSDLDYLDIIYQGKDMILDTTLAVDLIKKLCEVHGTEKAYTGFSTIYELAGKEYIIREEKQINDCEYSHSEVYEAMLKLSYKYSPALFAKIANTYRGSVIYQHNPGSIHSYFRNIS